MNYRHICNLVQAPTGVDTHGLPSGSDTPILANIPCQIESLSGRQAELAHQLYPSASKRIECVLSPDVTINTNMAFVEVATSKRFEIGYVEDEERNGYSISCLCSEILR